MEYAVQCGVLYKIHIIFLITMSSVSLELCLLGWKDSIDACVLKNERENSAITH